MKRNGFIQALQNLWQKDYQWSGGRFKWYHLLFQSNGEWEACIPCVLEHDCQNVCYIHMWGLNRVRKTNFLTAVSFCAILTRWRVQKVLHGNIGPFVMQRACSQQCKTYGLLVLILALQSLTDVWALCSLPKTQTELQFQPTTEQPQVATAIRSWTTFMERAPFCEDRFVLLVWNTRCENPWHVSGTPDSSATCLLGHPGSHWYVSVSRLFVLGCVCVCVNIYVYIYIYIYIIYTYTHKHRTMHKHNIYIHTHTYTQIHASLIFRCSNRCWFLNSICLTLSRTLVYQETGMRQQKSC